MGLTAWAGLFAAAELREADVVWVAAAAGAVGSLAAQFAKLTGHRVIGSAGSDEKVDYLLAELGLDAAFNYKNGPVADLLREAAPDGIDVYFDTVGGDHLEAALGALRRFGRVALCGAISQYEDTEAAARSEQPLPGDGQRPDAARIPRQQQPAVDGRDAAQVGAWLRDGELGYRETVVDGLEHAPEALSASCLEATTGRQDARAHRLRAAPAWIAAAAARPSEMACIALRGTSASPIT